jgi:predicted amidohydrolase
MRLRFVTDEELRALVRDAVARHVSPAGGGDGRPQFDAVVARVHASHGLLPLTRGSDSDGACLIEPAVRCNHCGYCLSYGH